jgi:(4S)-4-hydroxy-5-phosphonooxypentane-2,3-dione isomerase
LEDPDADGHSRRGTSAVECEVDHYVARRTVIALLIYGMASLAYGQTSAPGRLMIVVEFEVKPENRYQFLEVLKAQAQTTRAEDGCQQYDVMLPNNDPKHVLVVETWRDEASHSAHLNGPSFAKSRDASKDWIVDRKVTTGIAE